MKNIINNTMEATNNMAEKETKKMGRKGKKVKCLETGKIYDNMSDAAMEIGCSHDLISAVCRGVCKTAKGFHFEYVDSTKEVHTEPKPEAPIDSDIPKEIIVQKESIVKGKGKRMNGNTKSVFNFSTGDFYTSCADTAERLNASQSHVSLACRLKGRTVKGNKICYVEDVAENLDDISESIRKANMYDEVMSKSDKWNELVNNVQKWEDDVRYIEQQIDVLTSTKIKAIKCLEIARKELMKFKF